MSDTSPTAGSTDPLPSLEAIITEAATAAAQRREREAATTVRAAIIGPDIDAFSRALRSMLELEGTALRPKPEFDGQAWAPHLLTAGRLIGKHGWHDIVRQYAQGTVSIAEKAFIRLLIDIAEGRSDEAAVRRSVTDLHRADLVAAMSWQHPLDRWVAGVNGRFNAELTARLSPPELPRPPIQAPEPPVRPDQLPKKTVVNRGGRKRLLEATTGPTRDLRITYELVRREKIAHPKWGPQAMTAHFKNDLSFTALCTQAGVKKPDKRFFHRALQWIRRNTAGHKTRPSSVS